MNQVVSTVTDTPTTSEIAIYAERGRLRLEIPTKGATHVLYLSLDEAKNLQTQLSQSMVRIFQDGYLKNQSLKMSA